MNKAVPFKPLNEIGKLIRGSGLQKKDFSTEGRGCIHYGQIYTHYDLFTSTTLSKVPENLAKNLKEVKPYDTIIAITSENLEDLCKCVVWMGNESIVTGGHSVIFHHDQNPKFYAYYFQTPYFLNKKRKAAHGTKVIEINPEQLGKIMVPLPTRQEQDSITNFLDSFVNLISTLKDELTLREKQFEYYLNKSLSFDEECTNKTINEIFNLRNGYTPSKKNESFWQNGNVPWFRMDDIRDNGTILTDSIQHITSEAVKGELFKANSIILGTTATIGVHALILSDYLSNQQFTNLEIKEEYKNKLDSKFVYYYFFLIDEWCLRNSNKSSFASVDMRKLKKYNFPIPNIEVQKTIVKNLDLLTEYIDLLKQEINLRQKQYEYYRDKLLDFSEEEPK